MINFAVWLLSGGLIGWLANVVVHNDGRQRLLLNVALGIVGATLGGWLVSPWLGVEVASQDVLNIGALLVSLMGAIVLLAIYNLARPSSGELR